MSGDRHADVASSRRWWQVGLGVITFTSSVLVVLGWAWNVPSDALARCGALALLVVGVFYAGRIYVQLAVGYRNWTARDWTAESREELNRLVAVNCAISLALLTSGVWFFFHPHNGIQLAVSAVLGGAALRTIFATRDVLQRPGAPPRGSDRVEECDIVIVFDQRSDQMKHGARFLRALYRFCFAKTPRHELSGLAVVLVLTIFAVSVAHAAIGVPEVAEYMGLKPKPLTEKTQPPARVPGPPRSLRKASPSTPVPTREGRVLPVKSDDRIPTYEELCGKDVRPGDGAPPGQRDDLRRAWEAYGGLIAGCAGRARLVPGSADVYYVLGHRNGDFVSLGITSPEHPGAVLLDSAAVLAKRLAEEGRLRGASSRLGIGNGDFYVIYTTGGGWVVIRREKSRDAGYVQMPPAMAELWLRFGKLFNRTWPGRDVSRGLSGLYFHFDSPYESGTTLASGSCVRETTCELRFGNVYWGSSSQRETQPVTADRVLEHGPQ
jgi:hypothetical protein